MNEDLVTYEQAAKLKELGFELECPYHFTHSYVRNKTLFFGPKELSNWNKDTFDDAERISAPTLAQAQKWFREKGIIIIVGFSRYSDSEQSYYYDLKRIYNDRVTVGDTADTYEQALSAGIDKALELLKEK